MVKKSPLHPNYEKNYYDVNVYDLQEDFIQFLEEAKHHGKEAKLKSSSVYPEEAEKKGTEKDNAKKSWKSSLLSWWKADKKGNRKAESTKTSKGKVSEKRQGHVSGPLYNTGKDKDAMHSHVKSGPLTNLFNLTKGKGEENEIEIPYMSLNPGKVQSFGPIYKVT